MIGGDFNIERHRGCRGDKLQVCQHPTTLPFDNLWTFCSCLGMKRVLDHNLVTLGTQILSSKAIDDLRLRSDHRAVQTCIELPTGVRSRRKKRRKLRTDWKEYARKVPNVETNINGDLSHLETELWTAASTCQGRVKPDESRPWDTDLLRQLRVQRRSTICPLERKQVSKKIWRLTRDELRKYRTSQAEQKLAEFSNLEVLQKLHLCPIQKSHTIGPDLEACANLLQQVYTSDQDTKYAESFTIPLFTEQELKYGLKRMQKGRCADTDGISLEMFLYSGEENQQTLLECLNNVLVGGVIPSSWRNTFFTLLQQLETDCNP